MLKSLIAGLVALLATVGFHHATVATAPTPRSPYADTGLVHPAAQTASVAIAAQQYLAPPQQSGTSSSDQSDNQTITTDQTTSQSATPQFLEKSSPPNPVTPVAANQYATLADLTNVEDWVRAQLAAQPTSAVPQQVAAGGSDNPFVAASEPISTLTNVQVSGITGLTASEIPDLSGKYLSLNGGVVTGNTNFAGSLAVGTSTPYSQLEIWDNGTTDSNLLSILNNASSTVFSVNDGGGTNAQAAIGASGATGFTQASLSINAGFSPSISLNAPNAGFYNFPTIALNGSMGSWGGAPRIVFNNIRGTASSPAANANGDDLGDLWGQVYSPGSGYTYSADIQFQAAGSAATSSTPSRIVFFTTPVNSTSYTERMRIDSTGNVGIGNTNPLSILALAGNHSNSSWTTTGANLSIANNTLTDSSSGANSTIGNRAASSFGVPTFAFAIGTSTITNAATLYVAGAPKSDNASSTIITNAVAEYIASGALTSGVTTNGFGLYVNAPTGAASNYAAVFSGGNVGIGTASPYSRLQVTGPDTASTSAFAVINSASTTVFSVYDSGNSTYSGSIFQSSDERLKTDVQSLDASSSLSLLEELNPVSYLRIDQPGTGENLGFLAQEVEGVFPELVSTTSPTALTPDGTLTLNYTGLIAPIVSAIQELGQEIGSLEATVAGFARSFTSNQITATNELCIGATCIDQQQLAAILASQEGGASGSSDASATSTPDTPPVIQINGDNPATVDVGAAYNDLGADITAPAQDLNLGIDASVDGGATTTPDQITIDTSQGGTHTVLYCATDQSGLTTCATRAVNVFANDNSAATSAAATATP